ncbi:uncharacterized protein [Arachis hypogaea]|uniref:uncharacterized protein n=1 Tax=Arachis hypogaea TaxID=3818 RepID=UPI000DED0770|nr:uncharacterized protein LOC112742515 [Arachis hypogaea]
MAFITQEESILQGNALRPKERRAIYQRLMNKIFGDIIGKTVEEYVDDILAKTTRPEDLLSDLESVFTALPTTQHEAQPSQCAFAMEAGKAQLCQGRPETGGKAHRAISLPRASAAKALSFFNLMRKGIAFEWTPACEEAFNHFKNILATLSVPGKPVVGEPLYLYLAVTEEALAAVLVREEAKAQQTIYFATTILPRSPSGRKNGPGNSSSALKTRPSGKDDDLGHRAVQYDLRYEPRHAIKAQAMAYFLVEVTRDPTEDTGTLWKLHVDGASNQMSGGTRIILESPTGVIYEQSVKFEFPVSNNQAEYEALLGGLILAREVGATRLEVCNDSQIVTSQVNGSYQARDSLLHKYLERVKELSKQLRRSRSNTFQGRGTHGQTSYPSYEHKTWNRQPLPHSRHHERTSGCPPPDRDKPSWMNSITDFLQNGKLPGGEKEAKTIRREAAKYTVIQGPLFKKRLSQPLLKCLHPDQTDYVLREIHEGCCGHHIGGKALARKLIRAGYYWSSMMEDSKEFVKKMHEVPRER